MPMTVGQFVQSLTESGLMTADEVQAFIARFPAARRPQDGKTLARELVERGKLTKYQAASVYQGKIKGLVFGDYLVLDRIGSGGMGRVFKAQHRRMKRIVAIKVLSDTAVKSRQLVKRFQREVKASATLTHPNVVTAFDADEVDGVAFLVMEYIEGQDLNHLIKKTGPLPVGQAIDYLLQAARGLEYAHAQGLVHRDVKPGNLLVDKNGVVKILDLGLARFEQDAATAAGDERLTVQGAIIGTADYMPPEQAEDASTADKRADVYALGCTLYRILTLRTVYQGDSVMAKLMAHRDQPIPSLCEARPDAPIELDEAFRRMLAKRPEDRQQSMTEVIRDLKCSQMAAGGAAAAAPARAAKARPQVSQPVIVGPDDNPRKPEGAALERDSKPLAELLVDGDSPGSSSSGGSSGVPSSLSRSRWESLFDQSLHYVRAAPRLRRTLWGLAGLAGLGVAAVLLIWLL